MSSVIDYANRRVDVGAFQGATPRGEVLLRMQIADEGSSGVAVTGLAKLGQRFLLELLTEQGSAPYRATIGSSFMGELRSGVVRTQGELLAAFSRAMIDVRRNLVAEELEDDPLDEKLGDVSVDRVELSAGDAKIYIRLASQDPAAVAIVPIPITV